MMQNNDYRQKMKEFLRVVCLIPNLKRPIFTKLEIEELGRCDNFEQVISLICEMGNFEAFKMIADTKCKINLGPGIFRKLVDFQEESEDFRQV